MAGRDALGGVDGAGVAETGRLADVVGGEAEAVIDLIAGWLAEGVPPSEIAILVRQQSKRVTEALGKELHDRGIPHRNEQDSQDLAAEPVAALIFVAYGSLPATAVRTLTPNSCA